MAYETGTATDHYDLFAKIRTFLVTTSGWTELEYSSADNRLLWLKAPGLSGLEEIFVGLRTYQSIPSDYFNLSVFGATGWVNGNSYTTQPGFSGAFGVPCWDQSMTYWFSSSAQAFRAVIKVQNVETSIYLGKLNPDASPGQYPYPVVIGGCLASESETRYSDTTYNAWFKGNLANLVMRFVDGVWKTPETFPYNNTAAFPTRPTNNSYLTSDGDYGLYPIILNDADNIYGTLEGVYYITGFNNAAENTVVIGGTTYLVFRNIYRTGFNDYCAMRLT